MAVPLVPNRTQGQNVRLLRTLVTSGLGCLLLAQPLSSNAATFSQRDGKVAFAGAIEPYDAERFAMFLQDGSEAPRHVELNSAGGSLDAATKIASLVELFRLDTTIPKKATCASACFVIFLAGASRTPYRDLDDKNDARIGLHRPYLKAETSKGDVPVDLAKQRAAMARLRGYLVERNVPQRLVDEMMARPSNDVYWMTDHDIIELGNYSPEAEELYVANCDYRRNFTVSALQAGMSVAQAAEAQDKLSACESALQKRLRGTERLGLIRRMRAGWRPWS